MAKAYAFYNPLAGKGIGVQDLSALEGMIDDEVVFCNMTKADTYEEKLFSLKPGDYIIICGGDGTLNRFINLTDDVEIKNEICYYPFGSANDFAHDLGKHLGEHPFNISKYIKNLPYVEVSGRKYRFLNGVGYGIDAYCCEVRDKLRKHTDKTVNNTAIAIKGLLFHYKPTSATVTVDGERHTYHKVWLAPTMNGRYYGGGMMPTPNQERLGSDRTLSVMVFHGSGKLQTLAVFPSIFKGKHIAHTRFIEVLSGHEITVEFDRPTPLQIDGEFIHNVTSYKVTMPVMETGQQPAAAS